MSQELTNQTDTTMESSSSVDDSTSADEGQSAPLIPKDDAADPNETAEEKKQRISQTEWKNMKETVKKAKERDQKILDALGVKPEDAKEVDVVTELSKQIADLKSDGLKSAFEAQVPKVNSEKYQEAWKKITKEKKHLIQSGDVTYEDLWKMIRDEGEYQSQVRAVQETQKEEQEASYGSVPFFGNSVATTSDKLTGMDKEIARGMGWTEKTYQSAGVKL